MINFIGWLPWVGKTTLWDKIWSLDGFSHIDSDRISLEAQSNPDEYIEMVLSLLPNKMKPQSFDEFCDRWARWEYDRYISIWLFNTALRKAIENKDRWIKTVLSWVFHKREWRVYITQELRKLNLQAWIIYLKWEIDDLIQVSNIRTQSWIPPEEMRASPERIVYMSKTESNPLHEEWWNRVVKLHRDEVRRNVWEIPQLQFLFQ